MPPALAVMTGTRACWASWITGSEFSTQTEGTTIVSQRLKTLPTISWFLYSGSHSTRSVMPFGSDAAMPLRDSVSCHRGRPQMRSRAYPEIFPNARIKSWMPFAGMCVPRSQTYLAHRKHGASQPCDPERNHSRGRQACSAPNQTPAGNEHLGNALVR